MKKTLLTILFISLIFSCSTIEEKRQKSFDANYLKVKKNIDKWDQLLNQTFNYGTKYGYADSLIRPTKTIEIANPLHTQMKEMEVSRFWIRKLENECFDAEFSVDWDYELGSTALTWTSCDPKDSGTAFYNHWSGRIKIRQIDDNWWLWTTY